MISDDSIESADIENQVDSTTEQQLQDRSVPVEN